MSASSSLGRLGERLNDGEPVAGVDGEQRQQDKADGSPLGGSAALDAVPQVRVDTTQEIVDQGSGHSGSRPIPSKLNGAQFSDHQIITKRSRDPEFSPTNRATWGELLTLDEMAAIYRRGPAGLRSEVQRRTFVPAFFLKHPYRWRKSDVIRHLDGGVSLRRAHASRERAAGGRVLRIL